MKGIAPKIPDSAQRTALVGTHHTVGGILHHLEAVTAGNLHNGIHLTGHARVVHNNDCFGAVSDGRLNLALINIHRVGADIHKDQPRTHQHSGGRRTGEGVAGQNHLVTGLKPAQQHGHIQRRGAARRQQNLLCAETFLHPCVALFGKRAVSADFVRCDCLFDVANLIPGTGRDIKLNHADFHSL